MAARRRYLFPQALKTVTERLLATVTASADG
jgi:hypothetical protein